VRDIGFGWIAGQAILVMEVCFEEAKSDAAMATVEARYANSSAWYHGVSQSW